MVDFRNRSEIEKYIQAVTAPETGEDWLVALRDPRSPAIKFLNDEIVYNAVESYLQLEQVIIYNLEQKYQERLEKADQLRRELIDARKELINVRNHQAEIEHKPFVDKSLPLEVQITELQEAVAQQEEKVQQLEQRVQQHEESIQEQVTEWQEAQTERRDAFVEELKESFKNRFIVDDQGNAVVDENGTPVHAVVYDADGKEITMDPELDKARCEAVKAAIDKTPSPDKVYKVTEGNVTAEQCSKTNSLSRAINVVMALQALDPKSKDASSLKPEKNTSVSEVQKRIDKVREKGNAIERTREAYGKLNKVEVRLKEVEDQLKNATEGPEKHSLLAEKDKLTDDVAIAKKELDAIRQADAANHKKIKSNVLAAVNRLNGKDPNQPGVRSKPTPSFERFDGDKDKASDFEKKDVKQVADILDECNAQSATKAELAEAQHDLHDMHRDLKLLQDQKLEQEHGPGRGAGA